MKTSLMNKQKLLLGGLLAMLVISSFIYTPVIGDSHDEDEDEDDDGISDDVEEENHREIEVEYEEDEAQIESKHYIEGIENQIKIEMKTGDEGLEFKFEYEKDNNTVESEIEFKVKITEIVEYIDEHEDGFYNESIDEDVQVLKLDDFEPIVYSTDILNNETIHILSVITTDGVFSATIYMTGDFTEINDVLVAPTQMKIDIGIHNFNYTELDSALALKVKLESEREVSYEHDEETEDEEDGRASDEEGIDIALGDYVGFFSWIETAMVDGVEHVVKATPIKTELGENKMYLNYPRGTEIIHDPKIGIANIIQEPSTSAVGSAELLIVAVVAVFTLTGLSVLFRRKAKK